MKNAGQQIEESKVMLESVASLISNTTYMEIESRINGWTQGVKDENDVQSKSLPPLVMSSGGMPKPIDPLFFKLTS